MSRIKPRDETGASAVEYGLIVTAIAAMIVLVLFALGGTVSSLFDSSCQDISTEVLGKDC